MKANVWQQSLTALFALVVLSGCASQHQEATGDIESTDRSAAPGLPDEAAADTTPTPTVQALPSLATSAAGQFIVGSNPDSGTFHNRDGCVVFDNQHDGLSYAVVVPSDGGGFLTQDGTSLSVPMHEIVLDAPVTYRVGGWPLLDGGPVGFVDEPGPQCPDDAFLVLEARLATETTDAASEALNTLDILIDGTPPADGQANVFRWDRHAALLLSADEFTNLPRWIQGFDLNEPRTIEGFTVDCGATGCAEECDDRSCQDLEPIAGVCAFHYLPESFTSFTVAITWNGPACEITVQPGQPLD